MEDVLAGYEAAISRLVADGEVDPKQIVVLGHSAGGQLALWLASRWGNNVASNDRPQAPGPALVVGVAPCADLIEGARRRLSDEGDAVQRFMKCDPKDGKSAMSCYMKASPRHLLPLGVPQLIISGGRDIDVPADYVRSYFEAADKTSDECALLENAEADHYDLTNAQHPSWARTRDEIFRHLHLSSNV
jgi:acetyl esterase/lipase